MSRRIFLSHILGPDTPAYGGSKEDFIVEQTRCMHKGDTCNAMRWNMSNHVGTHMDAPLHFDAKGQSIDQLSAEWCYFNSVQLLLHPVEPASLISPGPWCDEIRKDVELLLIKTGFEKHRLSSLYWQKNPGMTPELGDWLRTQRPHIRAIGFDFISLTSYVNRPLGRKAHQAFLASDFSGKPLHIIEDMHLSELNADPKNTWVMPLRVHQADGGPVTVVAEI